MSLVARSKLDNVFLLFLAPIAHTAGTAAQLVIRVTKLVTLYPLWVGTSNISFKDYFEKHIFATRLSRFLNIARGIALTPINYPALLLTREVSVFVGIFSPESGKIIEQDTHCEIDLFAIV